MRLPFLKQLGQITRATVFPMDLAGTKQSFVLIYAIRLFFLVGRRLWHDKCPRQAAALAYQTFLSMIPLLILAVAFASTLQLDTYMGDATTFLKDYLLPDAAAEMGQRIENLVGSKQPRALGFVGAISLLAVALALVFTIEQVVNEIFRCKKNRNLPLRAILSISLIATAPVAIGFSVYYSGKLLFFVPSTVSLLLPLAFSVVVLFLCYWLLPHRKIQKRHSLISAIVVGVFLELMKLGFAFYASYLGETLSYVYGTMAILPLFMVWIYLTWLIFLFGAELNAALHEVKRYDRFDE